MAFYFTHRIPISFNHCAILKTITITSKHYPSFDHDDIDEDKVDFYVVFDEVPFQFIRATLFAYFDMSTQQFELVTRQADFKDAFKQHKKIAMNGLKDWQKVGLSSEHYSYYLLLCYAVECGLKFIIMYNEGINNDRNRNFDKLKTHDLEELVVLARKAQFNNTINPISSYAKGEIAAKQLHVIFRYNSTISSNHFPELKIKVEWLVKLQEQLSRQIK